MKILTFDVEANGFTRDVTEVHCIVTEDINTGEINKYHDYFTLPSDGPLDRGVKALEQADMLIGHNIKGYDLDVLRRLCGAVFPVSQLHVDTMLTSCILHPNMRENGLEAWFAKLGLPVTKIQIDDFSTLTSGILHRCVNDVKGNTMIYRHFLKEIQELQSKHGDVLTLGTALDTEQKVLEIHVNQVLHGVDYDIRLAESLVVKWDKMMKEIRDRILELAPKIVKPKGVEVKKPFIKCGKGADVRIIGDYEFPIPDENGTTHYAKSVLEWFNHKESTVDAEILFGQTSEESIESVEGPFTRIEYNTLNLNSGQQVKKFLLDLGWEPTEWNWSEDPYGNRVKTSPKLTEDSYDSLPPGLGQDIATYNILKHRRSLLLNIKDETQGSLPMARQRVTRNEHGEIRGNVPSDAFTCGTPTVRYTHIKPVANLPTPGARFGYESRAIYVPPFGSYQVGVDKSGIEARMLCHLCYPYPGGPEFAAMVLEGDWHSENARIWGVARRVAKIILYALT